jgi:hypothetical protein
VVFWLFNGHFLALESPNWSQKGPFVAKTGFYNGVFASNSLKWPKMSIFGPGKFSLVLKRA